jgi:hypothetical protein
MSPRKKVLAAYQMREVDPSVSLNKMSKVIGVHRSSIHLWLSDPSAYDPYYDRVAIERAVAGDAGAYDGLTVFERGLVDALLERSDTEENPATARFPKGYRDKVQHAIARRRARVEQGARRKARKIAPTKLTPEVCAKAKALRQQGRDFAVIGEVLGISRASVFRALNAA